MPRASAEERAADVYKTSGIPEPPPERLRGHGPDMWKDIIAAKPPGWFDAGSFPLLELYCATLNEAHMVLVELASSPTGTRPMLRDQLLKLNASCTSLATKLRLSVQASVSRDGRVLDEKGAGKMGKDKLIGGIQWQRLRDAA